MLLKNCKLNKSDLDILKLALGNDILESKTIGLDLLKDILMELNKALIMERILVKRQIFADTTQNLKHIRFFRGEPTIKSLISFVEYENSLATGLIWNYVEQNFKIINNLCILNGESRSGQIEI
jgi:hypothetical protein